MKLKNLVVLLGTVLIAAIALLWFGGSDGEARSGGASPKRAAKARLERGRSPHRGMQAKEAVKAALEKGGRPARKARAERLKLENDYAHFKQPKDRQIARDLQSALDDGNFDDVSRWAQQAYQSSEPELRQNAVEALGWFGEDALPELTVMMSDKDEDVAEAAMHQWELAASEIEDPVRQFGVTMAAFSTLKDENSLMMIGGIMALAANDVIDSDEGSADENRLTVVQALVDLIEGDSPVNAKMAKEAYSDITGNNWVSVDEAEKYLQNPDNYEAPDTDAEDDE